jgi:hypothetical protein
VASNITINPTTLLDLLAQLKPGHRENLLYSIDIEDQEQEIIELRAKSLLNKNHTISHTMLSHPAFKTQVFKALFCYEKFERGSVKFDWSVKTNGYAACALFVINRPKGLSTSAPKEYDKLIAIDPGVGNLVTWCDEEDRISGVSGKEYRHRAKFGQQKDWESGMRKRNPEYQQIIQDMPSIKTCNFMEFSAALEYRLQHFTYLFDFCASKPFLKWRFTTFVYSQKALTGMARKVVGSSRNTLIGLGDWSQIDGVVKGHPKAPSKRIEKALRKVADVVKVDEYRTSQICSKCKVGKTCASECRLEKVKICQDVVVRQVECHYVYAAPTATAKRGGTEMPTSRNIFQAFKCQYQGLPRPRYLARSTRADPDAEGYTTMAIDV